MAVCVVMWGGSPLQAEDLIDAKDPDRLMKIAEKIGSATLEKDTSEDPMIKGRTLGFNYSLVFYGCTDNEQCRDVTFSSSFQVSGASIDAMNSWNDEQHYTKAYLDDNGNPAIEMPLVLYAGVSEPNLVRQFERWKLSLKEFASYIKYD